MLLEPAAYCLGKDCFRKLSFEDPHLGRQKMSRIIKNMGIEISPCGGRNFRVRPSLPTKEDRIKAAQEILPVE